jgi:hypothetical protein
MINSAMSHAEAHQPPLRVFLCHSSGDKQAVRDLYRRLRGDGLDPWLDEENLLPGQNWDLSQIRGGRRSHGRGRHGRAGHDALHLTLRPGD